ncbi:IS3 family transposase [Paenibacillus thiaminolyticus]|uniref:HTH-like domain-containing protein n=1 Tax=Paenibacillus thiaminolyticus TaxID=49283 RepID=A0A3A3GG25_PANTH|nr:hypothetical protein DQX05_18520 [Paenibacillus thiaminolyticus]
MCSLFGVSKSGYYEWTKRKESNRSKRRKQLEKLIRRLFLDSRQLYGSPKIWNALKHQGVHIS